MQKYLLLIFIHYCFISTAQIKLNFSYDQGGNQTNRVLCINCGAKPAKGIKEEEIAEKDLEKFFPEDIISYYPNPVKEELYLKWQQVNNNYAVSISVFSVTGQTLRNYDLNASISTLIIPFQLYPTGMYVVLLSYNDGSEKSIKIIKQ